MIPDITPYIMSVSAFSVLLKQQYRQQYESIYEEEERKREVVHSEDSEDSELNKAIAQATKQLKER